MAGATDAFEGNGIFHRYTLYKPYINPVYILYKPKNPSIAAPVAHLRPLPVSLAILGSSGYLELGLWVYLGLFSRVYTVSGLGL